MFFVIIIIKITIITNVIIIKTIIIINGIFSVIRAKRCFDVRKKITKLPHNNMNISKIPQCKTGGVDIAVELCVY